MHVRLLEAEEISVLSKDWRKAMKEDTEWTGNLLDVILEVEQELGILAAVLSESLTCREQLQQGTDHISNNLEHMIGISIISGFRPQQHPIDHIS